MILLLLLGCASQLISYSQSSGTFVSTMNVEPVMELSLTNSASNIVFSTSGQYAAEYVVTNFNTVSIKSNQNWNVSLAATSSFFTASGSFSSSNMPASLCKIGVTGQSNTLSLSTSAQLLSTGNRGDEDAAGNTFDVTLKVNPGYNYGAGTYSLGIVYTLTAK